MITLDEIISKYEELAQKSQILIDQIKNIGDPIGDVEMVTEWRDEYQYITDCFKELKARREADGSNEFFNFDSPIIQKERKNNKENCWIPVSERLPEENGSYLVTVKRGYIVLGLWVGVAENWANVIAWMPSPTPYKESEEVPVKDLEGTKNDNEDIPIEYFESGGC